MWKDTCGKGAIAQIIKRAAARHVSIPFNGWVICSSYPCLWSNKAKLYVSKYSWNRVRFKHMINITSPHWCFIESGPMHCVSNCKHGQCGLDCSLKSKKTVSENFHTFLSVNYGDGFVFFFFPHYFFLSSTKSFLYYCIGKHQHILQTSCYSLTVLSNRDFPFWSTLNIILWQENDNAWKIISYINSNFLYKLLSELSLNKTCWRTKSKISSLPGNNNKQGNMYRRERTETLFSSSQAILWAFDG